MSCPHCCYSCDKETGQDMPFELFELILKKWGNKIIKEDKKEIVLGGGEPTVHPEFRKFLDLALSYGRAWIATNGKRTEDALFLNDLGKKNILHAILSLDKWHEPIDKSVVDAFKKGLVDYDHEWTSMISPDASQGSREIRSIREPYKRGNWKRGPDQCACKYIRVAPTGLIYGCGCLDSPVVGTVLDGFFDRFKNIPWYDTCFKDWYFVKK